MSRLRTSSRGPAVAVVAALMLGGCAQGAPTEGAPPIFDDRHVAVASADEAYLRQIAQMYGVSDPPEVDIEKEVGPQEQVDLVVECMHELGWPEVRVQDGGISYPWTPEVQDDVGRAMYTCYARYPLRPELFEPTEEMYRQLYDYYADELVPCLRSHGHEVSSPPSWEAWIASVQAGGDYWNPASEIDPARYPTDACPPLPPSLSS